MLHVQVLSPFSKPGQTGEVCWDPALLFPCPKVDYSTFGQNKDFALLHHSRQSTFPFLNSSQLRKVSFSETNPAFLWKKKKNPAKDPMPASGHQSKTFTQGGCRKGSVDVNILSSTRITFSCPRMCGPKCHFKFCYKDVLLPSHPGHPCYKWPDISRLRLPLFYLPL